MKISHRLNIKDNQPKLKLRYSILNDTKYRPDFFFCDSAYPVPPGIRKTKYGRY